MARAGASVSETGLRMRLLGPPLIDREGAPLQTDTRKATALLAFLAVTGGEHRRESLVALLWPDYESDRGRAALRRTLSTLRGALDGRWLESERGSVALARDELWLDVEAFRELLASCETHGHSSAQACARCVEPLGAAVELYRDGFLAGFGLRDSFAFEDWQSLEAGTLEREFAGALDRLARAHAAAGELERAIGCLERRLALEPLHEPAHRELMRLLAWTGRRATALDHYRECIRLLGRDLGVRPLEETTEVYRAIKEDRLGPAPGAAPAPVAAPAPAAAPAAEPARAGLPLVGRERELELLRSAWQGAGTRGRLVAVEGEAGVGKTRVLEELAAEVRAAGGAVISAHCYEDESGMAYGPLAEALHALAEDGLLRARLERVPDPLVAEAARLAPGLAGGRSGLPAPAPLDSPGAHTRFLDGTAELIAALGDERAPALLLVDDVQWADEASLDLLGYLARRLAARPLCVVATWRSEEVGSDHRARRLLDAAARDDAAATIELARLERPEVERLIESLPAAGELPAGTSDAVWAETEGLPFFVVEYIEWLSSEQGGGRAPLEGAQGLVRSRLQSVSETARQLLTAAAVIGRSFDPATLREASGRSDEEVVDGLEELIAAGLVREPDAGPALDFTHHRLREAVYEQAALVRRRLLHRRVAESLVAQARTSADPGALAPATAHHFQQAGEDPRAADFSERAGHHAASLFANAEALGHLRTALGLGPRDPAAVHEAIGDLETLTGDYRSARGSYEAAASTESGSRLAAIEQKLGRLHERRGDLTLAAGHFEAALESLDEAAGAEVRAHLLADVSLNARRHGDADAAQKAAEDAARLAEESGDLRARARASNALGVLARDRGDADEALAHHEEGLRLAREADDPTGTVAALNNLALTRRASGELDAALELTGEALERCTAQGDRHREAALNSNLADLLHAAGRAPEARERMRVTAAIVAELGADPVAEPELWKLVDW
jgi:DNA-binding SARP family transcriptional activator/RecA/RadA recombinase